MSSTDYRLPRDVIPKAYEIDLDASPARKSFSGVLVIHGSVRRATPSIELNARGLTVTDVKAGRAAVSGPRAQGKARPATQKGQVRVQKARETVELIFPKPLTVGPLRISLAFKGKLNPSMHGLYVAQDGPEKAIVSQCEATDARAIFPCFDEPDLKATLQWTIRTDPGLQVITNGMLRSRRKSRTSPIREIHTFEPTRNISTYLAAVTIGRFEGTAEQKVKGIPCRVWAGRGKLAQTAFAEEVTAQVLPWYERYFGQKYNYQKLDQVAVPGFDAGAMENVGAIFYRQNLLLMEPGTTSWAGQKRIAEVIAHEIAHQWFGNLVTMKWWDDLWLNEAFATWIAYKACDLWRPEWRMWDDFMESKQGALTADSLVSTHPIYTDVKSPAEATELFDVITYEKGCAVMRMMESFLGEHVFQAGIQRYQKAFRNKNATGADLWTKLEEASGQPVGPVMQSWIEQSGFPLITVSTGMRDGRTQLHLGQRRFFSNASEMQREHDQHWIVPMVLRYDLGNGVASHRVILQAPEATLPLPDEGHARWVYANASATGFYRMQLSDEVLADVLSHGLPHLSAAARMSLLDDQWALTRCGLCNIEQFMDVLKAYRDERDYIVIRAMVSRVAYLDNYWVDDEARPAFSSFVRWLFAPQLAELGMEGEPDEEPGRAVRRAAVLRALGDVGRNDEVLRQARASVAREMEHPTAVEPNLAGVVCSLAAIEGDARWLRRYVDTYLSRKQSGCAPELQSRYLYALASFENGSVSAKVLAHCLDGTVPQEQLRTVLVQMLGRRAVQERAWRFMQRRWGDIAPKVGSMGIARLVESTGLLPTHRRDQISRFFAANPVAEAQRALQKALEALDLRKEMIDREASRLNDWLGRESASGFGSIPNERAG